MKTVGKQYGLIRVTRVYSFGLEYFIWLGKKFPCTRSDEGQKHSMWVQRGGEYFDCTRFSDLHCPPAVNNDRSFIHMFSTNKIHAHSNFSPPWSLWAQILPPVEVCALKFYLTLIKHMGSIMQKGP